LWVSFRSIRRFFGVAALEMKFGVNVNEFLIMVIKDDRPTELAVRAILTKEIEIKAFKL
jgi:hypothetical protein